MGRIPKMPALGIFMTTITMPLFHSEQTRAEPTSHIGTESFMHRLCHASFVCGVANQPHDGSHKAKSVIDACMIHACMIHRESFLFTQVEQEHAIQILRCHLFDNFGIKFASVAPNVSYDNSKCFI